MNIALKSINHPTVNHKTPHFSKNSRVLNYSIFYFWLLAYFPGLIVYYDKDVDLINAIAWRGRLIVRTRRTPAVCPAPAPRSLSRGSSCPSSSPRTYQGVCVRICVCVCVYVCIYIYIYIRGQGQGQESGGFYCVISI
ncbi:hypothetical protein B484DRAFT_459177 [Ochromonadaceae sp. CCMP2298]|nr:hypothetical protein B484DRAFT_459177 [Ochromonadaceae sp. CCMP2298]